MIIDKETLVSDDQAITVTAASTNIIDLGNDDSAVQALNQKGNLEVFCQVTTTFAGGTSLKVSLQSDDSSTFASALTILESAAIVTASLAAGYQFRFSSLPVINEQYLRLYYTVVGTMSAGKILAGLVLDKQTNN